MPRVSKEAKAASHEKIVEVASKKFRERGIEAMCVADVMKAAGLTHGGFYRHFSSKEELAAVATARAFDEILGRLDRLLELGDKKAAMTAFIDMYMSTEHAANPGIGCPIAAYGCEAVRGSAIQREAMAAGIERGTRALAGAIGGERRAARQMAYGVLSMMVGSVVMARSADSDTSRDQILVAGRRLARQCLGL